MLYYGLFQLAVWWFCHEISLFWGIRFPFHAKSFETAHRTKYVHITMVAVGLVLPALPVIVTFTTGDPSGFGLTRFPPILCTGLQRDSTFYSLVLPINILMATGIPLLIIIFWIIHKVCICNCCACQKRFYENATCVMWLAITLYCSMQELIPVQALSSLNSTMVHRVL